MLNRVLVLSLTLPLCSLAQPDAEQVQRRLWNELERAEKLVEAKDAGAIPLLEKTERYLNEPAHAALARDNFFVGEARAATYQLLASAHAEAGHVDPALAYLRRLSEYGCWSDCLAEIRKQKAFAADAYKPTIAELKRRGRFWEGEALNTPYRDNIPVEEKLAGLSKFWSEVKYNFIFVDRLLEIDWDRLYLSTIPKVMATSSTVEYYRVLEAMCARLQDGHTNIYMPRQTGMGRGIPLGAQLIDGHVIVTGVWTHELSDQGIRPGLEVLEVDRKPIMQRATEDTIPYISASTSQAREAAAFGYTLFRGSENSVHVKLQDTTGKVTEHDINRNGYKWDLTPKGARVESKVLPGRIGYLAVNDCGGGQNERIDEAFPKLLDTDALIVDLRRNGGGSSGVGYHLLGYLTDRAFPNSRQVVRHYIPTYRARGMEMEFVEMPATYIEPHRKALYTKPVFVLTSTNTASAAEDFCVAFRSIHRGKFIGEPTYGSTGQPLQFKLPGGGAGRICTKHDTYPDGTAFVGVGVLPDIPVKQTLADLRAGVDTVFEAAVNQAQALVRVQAR